MANITFSFFQAITPALCRSQLNTLGFNMPIGLFFQKAELSKGRPVKKYKPDMVYSHMQSWGRYSKNVTRYILLVISTQCNSLQLHITYRKK